MPIAESVAETIEPLAAATIESDAVLAQRLQREEEQGALLVRPGPPAGASRWWNPSTTARSASGVVLTLHGLPAVRADSLLLAVRPGPGRHRAARRRRAPPQPAGLRSRTPGRARGRLRHYKPRRRRTSSSQRARAGRARSPARGSARTSLPPFLVPSATSNRGTQILICDVAPLCTTRLIVPTLATGIEAGFDCALRSFGKPGVVASTSRVTAFIQLSKN